jgi:hypothetical protein
MAFVVGSLHMFRDVLAVVLVFVAVPQSLTGETLTITFRQSGFYDGESSWFFCWAGRETN